MREKYAIFSIWTGLESELFPHGSIPTVEFRNLNIVKFLDCSVRETDPLDSSTGNKTESILKKNGPKFG